MLMLDIFFDNSLTFDNSFLTLYEIFHYSELLYLSVIVFIVSQC